MALQKKFGSQTSLSKSLVDSFQLLIASFTGCRHTYTCCMLVFASQHFLCFITHNNNKQGPQHFYCCPFKEGFPQISVFIVSLDSMDRCLDIIIKEVFFQ